MGFSVEFDPAAKPYLTVAGRRYYFDVHEAGYHNIFDGGFRCAEDKNLKKASRRAKSIDSAGRQNIQIGDLLSKLNTVKHGRIWSIHVWFDPDESGWRIGTKGVSRSRMMVA